MKNDLSKRPANSNAIEPEVIEIVADPKQVVKMIAAGLFTGCTQLLQQALVRPALPAAEATDVMTADEVAELLRLDRKTVYDYAGRGEIPCQRLGKRILFSRAALVSWLSACKGSSERGSG